MNEVVKLFPEAGFDEFYRAYPRKVAKRAAMKAWDKVLRCGAKAPEILAGLERWKGSAQFPSDMQFVPHPATWLNGWRWEDEFEPLAAKRITAADIERRIGQEQ